MATVKLDSEKYWLEVVAEERRQQRIASGKAAFRKGLWMILVMGFAGLGFVLAANLDQWLPLVWGQ